MISCIPFVIIAMSEERKRRSADQNDRSKEKERSGSRSKKEKKPVIDRQDLSRAETVEQLSAALLREYMHKKKYKDTLAQFDLENPRVPGKTITSRALMGELMGMDAIQSRNARRIQIAQAAAEIDGSNPDSVAELQTFMELLCGYRVRKRTLRKGVGYGAKEGSGSPQLVIDLQLGDEGQEGVVYDSSDEERDVCRRAGTDKEEEELQAAFEVAAEALRREEDEYFQLEADIKAAEESQRERSTKPKKEKKAKEKKSKKKKREKDGKSTKSENGGESPSTMHVRAGSTKLFDPLGLGSGGRSGTNGNHSSKPLFDPLGGGADLSPSRPTGFGAAKGNGWTPGGAVAEVGLSSLTPNNGNVPVGSDDEEEGEYDPNRFLTGGMKLMGANLLRAPITVSKPQLEGQKKANGHTSPHFGTATQNLPPAVQAALKGNHEEIDHAWEDPVPKELRKAYNPNAAPEKAALSTTPLGSPVTDKKSRSVRFLTSVK